MTVQDTTKQKLTPTDEVRAEIIAVAATATDADKRRIAEVIERAKGSKFAAEVFVITPPMAAILFLEHNPHNRDWRADGFRSCREYARRMTQGLWQRNNAAIGFYVDGQLEDGQHRLSAAALARHTIETTVVFGIERDAIVTVDDLLARHGADHAKLHGIADAPAKQTIIKMAAAYLVKAGETAATLKSEAEIHEAIRANNSLLEDAIAIGNDSRQNIIDPVLKPAPAQTVAYLMLSHGWEPQRIREKLALFQTGVSADGEKTPYFVAAEVIKNARKRAEAKDRLSTVKELGVTIYAMVSAESGVNAIGAGSLKAAVKKALPNPSYPQQMAEAAD